MEGVDLSLQISYVGVFLFADLNVVSEFPSAFHRTAKTTLPVTSIECS
jgi:hypothetical protein